MSNHRSDGSFDMAAAIEHVRQRQRREPALSEAQLVTDAIEYWMGGLDDERLHALVAAMTHDRGVSEYVLDVGAALEREGLIETRDDRATLYFRPTRAPLIAARVALAASTDLAPMGIDTLEHHGYRLEIYASSGVVAATLVQVGEASAPVADAVVTLSRVRSDGVRSPNGWTGRTDASGNAILSGEGFPTPPGDEEYYEFVVELPDTNADE